MFFRCFEARALRQKNEQETSNLLKKLTWPLVLALVLGTAGCFAVGGTSGVALLMVKYVVRKSYGPPQTIEWQAGPTAVAAHNTAENLVRRPPNVILIVTEDLGFNDITHNGGGLAVGKVPTPNFDSIASQGADFINGCPVNATCAPSPASLRTERYATRFGFEFTPKELVKLVAGIPYAQQTVHGGTLRDDAEDQNSRNRSSNRDQTEMPENQCESLTYEALV